MDAARTTTTRLENSKTSQSCDNTSGWRHSRTEVRLESLLSGRGPRERGCGYHAHKWGVVIYTHPPQLPHLALPRFNKMFNEIRRFVEFGPCAFLYKRGAPFCNTSPTAQLGTTEVSLPRHMSLRGRDSLAMIGLQRRLTARSPNPPLNAN